MRSRRSMTGRPSKYFRPIVSRGLPLSASRREAGILPSSFSTLTMAVFRREDASCTSLLPAVWPLRMRVNRSEMGSVLVMRRPSPARLGEAGNLTAAGDLAELHPREAELAVHAARAAGDGATVALPRCTRVPRLRLQLRLRSHALLGRALGAADQLLELRALHRVLFHDPGATLLALDHAGLRHRLYGSCYFRNGKLNASSNARP